MSPGDLAELLGAFNEATSKLQAAHESLSAEVVRLQRELSQANEQLERSRRLAALGEMAAGIAHEIRNPLGSIRLYAKMLDDDLGRCGRSAEQGLAQRIGGAVRTVDAVVRDVLAFAGDSRIRPEPVCVDELFTRAIEESLSAVPIAVRVVRRDRDSDVSEAWGDPALLHRALVNIISNALQAMQERADCGSRAAKSELVTTAGSRRTDDPDAPLSSGRTCIALGVADSGPGVPPQVMERMFNPFFTTRATGTGLGLAIVHRIIDAHGGRTSVRNLEERGAIVGAAVELLLPMPSQLEDPNGSAPSKDTLPMNEPVSPARHRRRSAAATARPTPFRVTEDAS